MPNLNWRLQRLPLLEYSRDSGVGNRVVEVPTGTLATDRAGHSDCQCRHIATELAEVAAAVVDKVVAGTGSSAGMASF